MVSLTAKHKADLLKSPSIQRLKKQYDAKMKGKGKRMMKGMGFWDNLGKALGSAGKKFLDESVKKGKEIDKFLRDTKVISKVSDFISKGADGVEKVAGVATMVAPELAEITVPILAGAEATKDIAKGVRDTSKSVGFGHKYGQSKMKMGGKGLSKPLMVRPKGVSVKVLKPPPSTLTIRRDGVFEKTSYPTHVSVQPVKLKGKGVRAGTFNSVYSEFGKTVGL